MKNKILIFFLLITSPFNAISQAVGDFGTINSGSWTDPTIWRQWDGVGWNTVPASFPNASTQNVNIRNGHIVTVPTPGPYNLSSLKIESNAKLYSNNSTTNVYLSVWGFNIICDGEIGNGTIFDGIGFNFEAFTTTISGSGKFTASRFRKNSTFNQTTNLYITMSVTLKWDQSSNTQIYNNAPDSSFFNVNIDVGDTLNCLGSPTNPGNVAIDGVFGTSTAQAAGTFSVNGVLIVTGIIYATTNNVYYNTTTKYNCIFQVNPTGIIIANQINSPASGSAGMKFVIQGGGKLELNGPNGFNIVGWSTTNNTYDYMSNSTVNYSAVADQTVLVSTDFVSTSSPSNQYWHLILSGSGTKKIRAGALPGGLWIRGNCTIMNNAILDQLTNFPDISIGGNWTNYNQSAFIESNNVLRSVRFCNATVSMQTIYCPGGEEFFNLWIAKSSNLGFPRVKLLSPIKVYNKLTLGQANTVYYGILELNKNQLSILNSSPSAITLLGNSGYYRFIVSEDSSTTNGSMVNWTINSDTGTYVFPFGYTTTTDPTIASNPNNDTIPFILNKPTTDSLGIVSVATYKTLPNNRPLPTLPILVNHVNSLNPPFTDNSAYTIDRFWYLGVTKQSLTLSGTFTYSNRFSAYSELPQLDNNPSNLRAQYWVYNINSWQNPQLGSPNLYTVKVTNIPVFNNIWTLSSINSPLPVELIEFNGRYYNTGLKLYWSTASEINNDHFDILKSFDGINYFKLKTLKGSGNSNTIINYEYIDYDVCDTLVYYKLKQVDFDGVSKEYDPIAFKCRGQHIYDDFYDVLGRKTRMDFDGIKIYQK